MGETAGELCLRVSVLSDAEKFKEEFEAVQAILGNKEDKLTQDMEKLTMNEGDKVKERRERRGEGLGLKCLFSLISARGGEGPAARPSGQGWSQGGGGRGQRRRKIFSFTGSRTARQGQQFCRPRVGVFLIIIINVYCVVLSSHSVLLWE